MSRWLRPGREAGVLAFLLITHSPAMALASLLARLGYPHADNRAVSGVGLKWAGEADGAAKEGDSNVICHIAFLPYEK